MNDKGHVIVTGASRGIGRACCEALLQAGYRTISLSRTDPGQPLEGDRHYSIDLSDLEQTDTLLSQILNQYDITGLVCNAGRGDIGSLENFSPRQIRDSITLNLISPLCVARRCLPTLRSRSRSDIVFIGSTSALQGARYGSIYSAAKFGLRGAAQSLLHELSGANCHVGIVQPGMVRTDFFEQLDFEPGPLETHALQAEDVADAVLGMFNAPDHASISELTVQPRHHVVQKRSARQPRQKKP